MKIMDIQRMIRISGKGTAMMGKLECDIKIGDRLKIYHQNFCQEKHVHEGRDYFLIVIALTTFFKCIDSAKTGEEIGILIRGVDKNLTKEMVLNAWKENNPYSLVNVCS